MIDLGLTDKCVARIRQHEMSGVSGVVIRDSRRNHACAYDFLKTGSWMFPTTCT
jgi:hypothetical protein